MKMIRYKKLLIAFIAMGSWIVANSQQYPDSLLSYLEIAAKNNPLVLQRLSEYQASLHKVPQVASLPDPELSAGVFLNPMELVSGNQIADLRLMQMFPWFGVLKNAKDEMSLMANSKFKLYLDSKLQALYDVQHAWYELYKVQKEISISEKNIEILKVIERLALVKFRSASLDNVQSGSSVGAAASSSMQTSAMGSSPDNSGLADIYRIQIEEGDLENSIEFLKNQRNSILSQFNGYLNRQPLSPVFTNEEIIPDTLEFSLIVVSDSMIANNPMLGMLEYEKQSIEARKKMISRMGYPMVGLGLNYSIISKNAMSTSSMNGKDMIMPMAVVTLPIYRKKYIAMQSEAELLESATSQKLQAASNSLQVEYYQAVQLYKDAQRRIKLYDSQYNLASKSFDLMLRSFTVSSSGLTDVLRVRQQKLDYELRHIEAIADLNTSIAWLKRLMAFSQVQ